MSTKIVPYKSTYSRKLNAKLNRMQRQINANKPEIKHINHHNTLISTLGSLTVNAIDLGNIGFGDSVSSRTGNLITITGIDIRCYINNSLMNAYLLYAPAGNVPTNASFEQVWGGHLLPDSGTTFTEIALLDGTVDNFHLRFKKRMRLKIKYQGANSLNRLWLVFRNADAVAHDYAYSAKVYFSDA